MAWGRNAPRRRQLTWPNPMPLYGCRQAHPARQSRRHVSCQMRNSDKLRFSTAAAEVEAWRRGSGDPRRRQHASWAAVPGRGGGAPLSQRTAPTLQQTPHGLSGEPAPRGSHAVHAGATPLAAAASSAVRGERRPWQGWDAGLASMRKDHWQLAASRVLEHGSGQHAAGPRHGGRMRTQTGSSTG